MTLLYDLSLPGNAVSGFARLTQQSSPRQSAWVAPVVLALTLLLGAVLHYWPEIRPGRLGRPVMDTVRGPAVANAELTPAKPPVKRLPPAATRVYPARNTRVARSESCRDCESYYLVHDGKGGTIRRSEGYTTRCCRCGSTVTFSDGYTYNISCEDNRIRAKLVSSSGDATGPR